VDVLLELLTNVARDIAGSMGAAVTIRRHDHPVTVLAAIGVAETLVPHQVRSAGGPVPGAATDGMATWTDDLFADPRWPALTRASTAARFPAQAADWNRVRGVAAVPGEWDESGAVVLSVTLDRAVDDEVLGVLTRYERLMSMILQVTEMGAGAEHSLEVLQSRAVIEQAKGVLIAARRCTAEEAWTTLRRGSQEFNVKLRELATALVEHLSGVPSPTPAGLPAIVPDEQARLAAEQVWLAFTSRPAETG
jgi:ANTAR domain